MSQKRKLAEDDEEYIASTSKMIRVDNIDPSQMTDTPSGKGGRVRKKSTKVKEMEEFEEAERTKAQKKAKTPPEPARINPALQSGSALQAANIQLNLMSALKSTQIISPEQSVTMATTQPTVTSAKKSSSKRKEETVIQQIQQQEHKNKPLSKKNVMVVPGLIPNYPGVTTIEAGVIEQQMSIKEEPIETVDPNVLLPQVVKGVKSPTLMQQLHEESDVKPTITKSAKKGKGKHVSGEQGTGSKGPKSPTFTIKTEPGQSPSVIKMLLNKPTQFTDPVVSTQSLTKSSEVSSPPKSEPKSGKKSNKAKKDLVPEMLKVDTSVRPVGSDTIMGSPNAEERQLLSLSKRKQKMSPLNEDIEEDDEELDDLELDDDEDDDDDIDPEVEDGMDWEFETQDGSLIIAEGETKTKKTPKKAGGSGKKKAKMKSSNDTDSQPSAKKEKKKKRLTAYTMWCNSVRNKVLFDNPKMDFAQLSRRLGEIWQTVSSKEKQNWKRKAKREARRLLGKGLLITTGKQETVTTKKGATSAAQPTSTSSSVSESQPSTSHNPPPIHHPPIRHKGSHARQTVQKPAEDSSISSRTLGIEPIDTAAHLKLVGDSLSIIGMRLQEHRGLIAVQGSLSVLLDSMLCALGPLMCLTAQVPELHGCSVETHSRTLENIAYIMPGL